jgi:hypothetical protein
LRARPQPNSRTVQFLDFFRVVQFSSVDNGGGSRFGFEVVGPKLVGFVPFGDDECSSLF